MFALSVGPAALAKTFKNDGCEVTAPDSWTQSAGQVSRSDGRVIATFQRSIAADTAVGFEQQLGGQIHTENAAVVVVRRPDMNGAVRYFAVTKGGSTACSVQVEGSGAGANGAALNVARSIRVSD